MKRTIIHTRSGKKEYAVRKADGRFSDIQNIKRSKQLDLKFTAKSEKRQRLINYITSFAVRISNGIDKDTWNTALEKMMKKIDKLKLF
jgi:hypothetical protein